MKKILVLISPFIFTLFIACSGGEDQPAPMPAALGLDNPNDQQALRDLQLAAMAAKQECSSSMSPVFLLVATRIQSGAPGIPMIPPGSGGGCSNSMMNFLMQYATLGQGRYANDPSTRPWFTAQIGGIMNRVGGFLISQGVQMTPDLQQKLFVVAARFAKEQIIPGLSPNVRGPACAGMTQFGSGC